MAKKLRWGLIGTGRIARKFAQGLAQSRTGELVAVGSRTPEAAREFTKEFPATAHGSYEALLANPAVEAVYLSTPHPWHAQWVAAAARAGKHILCEKPFAMNHAEASEALAVAWKADVFVMEAFMYRCHPQTLKLRELLREGVLGNVRLVRASFAYDAPFAPESRVDDPRLGGGGILDVGCYCVSMVRLIAGETQGKRFAEPVEVRGVARLGPTGVDEVALALLKFPDGLVAELATGTRLQLENNVRIVGSKASLLIPEPWTPSADGAGFSKLILFRNGLPEEIVIDADRGLYAIEADHVAEQIAAGRRESPAMPWEDTLGNLKALDFWRESVGLRYEADGRYTNSLK